MAPDRATLEAMRNAGFHYDEGKNKYFKIARNSDNLAYSAGNVQDRNTRDERAREVEARKNKYRDQIKRSPILEDIHGDFLSREHGGGRVDGPRIYAAGLRAKFCASIPIAENATDGVMSIEPRPEAGASQVDINIGSHGAMLSGSLQSSKEKKACNISASKEPLPWIENIKEGNLEKARRIYFVSRGPATSLSVNYYRRQLAMTWFSGTFAAGIALVPMATPGADSQSHGLSAVILGPGTAHEEPRMEIDVLCSTAAPPSSEYMFVFGTSHGIMTLDSISGRNLNRLRTAPRSNRTPSWKFFEKDVLAVHFFDNDPNTLLSGNRAGLLTITDFREAVHSGSNSFRHPSAITHIRSINSHQVVVAGMKSQMCLYDRRFVKRSKSNDKGPLKSVPVVTYPEYYNESIIRHGFDVDVETGIIAAAQEPHIVHDAIKLFSIHDGCALDTPFIASTTREVSKEYQKEIYSSLQIVEDEPGGAKSIWGLRRGHLERFCWHGQDD